MLPSMKVFTNSILRGLGRKYAPNTRCFGSSHSIGMTLHHLFVFYKVFSHHLNTSQNYSMKVISIFLLLEGICQVTSTKHLHLATVTQLMGKHCNFQLNISHPFPTPNNASNAQRAIEADSPAKLKYIPFSKKIDTTAHIQYFIWLLPGAATKQWIRKNSYGYFFYCFITSLL